MQVLVPTVPVGANILAKHLTDHSIQTVALAVRARMVGRCCLVLNVKFFEVSLKYFRHEVGSTITHDLRGTAELEKDVLLIIQVGYLYSFNDGVAITRYSDRFN